MRLILGIFFIKDASGSTGFKTKTYLIFIIFMLSRKSSLYITSSRTLKIFKNFNLAKFNLLLSRVVQINIIFVLGILCRRYILFFFLRVSPLTLFLLINFFIALLKKIKFCWSFSYNLWIFSTIITIYNISSSYSLISIKTLALNFLFIENGVLLVILYSDVLYASILMGNNLT